MVSNVNQKCIDEYVMIVFNFAMLAIRSNIEPVDVYEALSSNRKNEWKLAI